MGQTSSRNSPLNPLKTETVFKSAVGSIYRIPALFHMKGTTTLLAVAERRKGKNDHSATYLYMKTGTVKEEHSDVKTIEWSEIKLLKEACLPDHRSMNPCPVYEETTKKLFLFFTCVEGNTPEWKLKYDQTHLCYVTSEDLGQSWSKLTDLTYKLSEIKDWDTFAVGPGHGLQTESGRLIIPAYAYKPATTKDKKVSHALSLYSDDCGKQWHFGKMLVNQSFECQMVEISHKHIYCNARTKGIGKREEVFSENDGQEFKHDGNDGSKLVETDDGCQGSAVSFPAQSKDANTTADPNQNPNKWLLYTHPTQHKRKALGVYLNKSPQNPTAWSKPWIINEGPSGYSDLVYIGDGWFACLVECGKKCETEQIASVVFNYNQVKQAIGE